MSITVSSMRAGGTTPPAGTTVVRVDRSSILGNPFRLASESERPHVIAQYRRWLWARIQERGAECRELQRIAKLSEEGHVALNCWCAPKACHADIIKSAAEWLLEESA